MPTSPAKTTRSTMIELRVSPAEKALVQERAAAAGLKVSEYIRREAGIGHFGRADLRRGVQLARPVFKERVLRNARQEARERAKAALAGTR